MKRRKTDVEQHGSDMLMVFLTLVGLAFITVFIYNHF